MSLREPVSARKPPPPQAVPWHRRPWWDAVQFALAAALLIGLTYHGATQMGYQWKWDRVPRYVVRVIDGEWLAGPLLKGLMVTVELALKASVLALLTVAAALRQPEQGWSSPLASISLQASRPRKPATRSLRLLTVFAITSATRSLPER